MHQQLASFLLSLILLLSGCATEPYLAADKPDQEGRIPVMETGALSGVIPEELEYVPMGYTQPAQRQGSLEKLEYETSTMGTPGAGGRMTAYLSSYGPGEFGGDGGRGLAG